MIWVRKKELDFSDLELIFKDLKSLFEKRFYHQLKALEKQSLNETINAFIWHHHFHLRKNKFYLKLKI